MHKLHVLMSFFINKQQTVMNLKCNFSNYLVFIKFDKISSNDHIKFKFYFKKQIFLKYQNTS